MQIKNLQIFSSTVAADGSWVDVSNLVNLSVYITGVDAQTWIEVSNDPNAPIDGTGIGAPGSAPVLSQFLSQPGNLSTQPPNPALITSQLPATTFHVQTTYVTKWGETTASAAATLAVSTGNYLYVAPAAPSAAQAPYVTGYNVYISLTGGAGTYVLQTGPNYSPMRLIDGVGTPGGTVNPLGPNQSTHFAISGAISITQPGFAMTNGFQQTQWVPPSVDASGGAAVGLNISGNLPGSPSTGSQTQVLVIGTAAMFNPSGLVWKWLRVRKTGATTLTTAYLVGQNG
jgi:hypothetical protein